MNSVAQMVQAQAIGAAASLLDRAAAYAELHARKPLFQKTMRRRGGPPVLVRLDWPGVLRVFDPATCELLAESALGQLRQLRRNPAE